MEISRYLAMTAGELAQCPALPEGVCYMACHFSAYGTGLENIPRQLPPGAMLMVNDLLPIRGHDPERITGQLREAVDTLDCGCVVLDLQRPEDPEAAALCQILCGALPCPVGVSHFYARELDCPVLLPPVPPDQPVQGHIAPWQGREIWLEAAREHLCIRVDTKGASVEARPWRAPLPEAHTHETLHCRYTVKTYPDRAEFLLWRTPELTEPVLAQASALGIRTVLGLYQQLGPLWTARK